MKNKNIWLIWKYCRLPSDEVFPARGFSLMREFDRRGYDCSIIGAKHEWNLVWRPSIPGKSITTVDGVRVVTLNVLSYTATKSLRRILGWIHFEFRVLTMGVHDLPKPDVIIVSSLSLLSVISGLIYKTRFSCKLVFEVRDIWPLILTENGGFSRFNPFVRILSLVEWLGYKYSDHIVATMPNLTGHVSSILGYNREVTCIPMGVPKELLEAEIPDFPKQIEKLFPNVDFVVTHAGSVGIDNALDTLLESARLLKGEPGIAFFIIGKGDLINKYKEICSDLSNIVFADSVPSRQLQPILRRSSVLYFATHPTIVLDYGQSLNKLVDYMFAGRPVIGSYSGFPSMVNEADCGEFVPAGDAKNLAQTILRWSKLSSEELSAIGERGRRWIVDNRNYERLADDYISVID
jgi:glycosyltransferase involved in cell wall biosynthesis